jgi:hypothetical protein
MKNFLNIDYTEYDGERLQIAENIKVDKKWTSFLLIYLYNK